MLHDEIIIFSHPVVVQFCLTLFSGLHIEGGVMLASLDVYISDGRNIGIRSQAGHGAGAL